MSNTAQDFADRAATYGVHTDGEVVGHEYHEGVDYADRMTLAELSAAGGRISRVRILQERGLCDISYIHGVIELPCPTCKGSRAYAGGMGCSTCQSRRTFYKTVPVNVGQMPTGSHLLPRRSLKGAFIEWAKEERVFAKGLGLLDESNWSVLRG